MNSVTSAQDNLQHIVNFISTYKPEQEVNVDTLKSDFMLDKQSLSLIKDETDPYKYHINFVYSAEKTVLITFYFMCKEDRDPITNASKGFFTDTKGIQPKCYRCPAGRYRKFPTDIVEFIPSNHGKIENFQKENENVCPLVIKMTAEKSVMDLALYYYCTFAAGEDKQLTKIKMVREKMDLKGIGYCLEEIYSGECEIENKSSIPVCIICFGKADILLYPCRHFCLCEACAKLVKDENKQCPICRNAIEKQLQVKSL